MKSKWIGEKKPFAWKKTFQCLRATNMQFWSSIVRRAFICSWLHTNETREFDSKRDGISQFSLHFKIAIWMQKPILIDAPSTRSQLNLAELNGILNCCRCLQQTAKEKIMDQLWNCFWSKWRKMWDAILQHSNRLSTMQQFLRNVNY